MDKLKKLLHNDTLQDILILSILYIVFSTSFYRDLISKIPFISSENNILNTSGLLVSALLISIIFILIRTFI